jgi:hypothetical protein
MNPLDDSWTIGEFNPDTGLWPIETVTCGTDVPTKGYEVAYCASLDVAMWIVEAHARELAQKQ